ncbi:hypothetical protein HNQ59_002691 [Chitinivorax tropicus]|uniref:Lipoprotein n=1 Tax=Chitinivorax tropicus TaxID=714531 RepID=A0A840MLV7_9PROT|nr:hypothetical protein [Chitinivorax tropicus]MBB5019390.1 hypothetical protein [Chitinivorax tropicus]
MSYKISITLVLAALLLSACSTPVPPPSVTIEEKEPPPQPAPPTNQGPASIPVVTARAVKAPPTTVMKQMLISLNREKSYKNVKQTAANRIALILPFADPSHYIDCGQIEVPGLDGDTLRFPGASPQQQYQLNVKGRTYEVTRKLNGRGEAVISLTPRSNATTTVSVRITYRLSREQIATAPDSDPIKVKDALMFRSGRGAAFARAPTRCVSSGIMEKQLLDLAQASVAQ